MSCQRAHSLFFLSLRSNGTVFGPKVSFTITEMKPYSSGQKSMHVNIGSEGLSRTALISQWTRQRSRSESHSQGCSHSIGEVRSQLGGPPRAGQQQIVNRGAIALGPWCVRQSQKSVCPPCRVVGQSAIAASLSHGDHKVHGTSRDRALRESASLPLPAY
jgi:hypothetical protein